MENEERQYEKFQEFQARVGRRISLSEACLMVQEFEDRINSAYEESAKLESQFWEDEEDDCYEN